MKESESGKLELPTNKTNSRNKKDLNMNYNLRKEIINKYQGNWKGAFNKFLNEPIESEKPQQSLDSPFVDDDQHKSMSYQNQRGVFKDRASGYEGDFFDFAGRMLGIDARKEFKKLLGALSRLF